LLDERNAGTLALSAPEHLVGEVANGLRKRVARGHLSVDEALSSFEELAGLDLDFVSGTERWFRTLQAATDWQVTTYDALYVLLAGDLETEVVTADQRLLDAARESSLPVRSLSA
jgi:predicted nucleic acid-binding protein